MASLSGPLTQLLGWFRRAASHPRTGVSCLAGLAAVFLGMGLALPTCTFAPSFGGPVIDLVVADIARLIGHSTAEQTSSLLSLIARLGAEGRIVLFAIVLAGSVVFPVAKLVSLAALSIAPGERSSRWAARFHRVNHLSMLDVFLLAILISVYHGFPLGTAVIPRIGIYCFALSVALTMRASALAKKHGYFQSLERVP